MSATGLEVFDRTLQITNVWLDDLMNELGWTDRQRAYHALRSVLHVLRDRLPVNVAAHLSSQLPLLIRGMFFEGWQPARTPVRERTAEEFLAHIADAFVLDLESDPRQVVRGVAAVLEKHVSPGEMEKVRGVLPASIRELLGPGPSGG